MVALPTCDSYHAFRDPLSQSDSWVYDAAHDECASIDGASSSHENASDVHFQYHDSHVNPLHLFKSPLSFPQQPYRLTKEDVDCVPRADRENRDLLHCSTEVRDQNPASKEVSTMGTHTAEGDNMHSNQGRNMPTCRDHSQERNAGIQDDLQAEQQTHLRAIRPSYVHHASDSCESEEVISHEVADEHNEKLTPIESGQASSCKDESLQHDFDKESQASLLIERSDDQPPAAGFASTDERTSRPSSAAAASNVKSFCVTDNIHRGYETVTTSSKSPNVMDVRVHVISDRFNACNPCRQRKIKCAPNDDINGPTAGMCGTCVKRKKECSWPESMTTKQSHHHGHAALHTGNRFFVGRKTEMTIVPVQAGAEATMPQRHDQYGSTKVRDASNGLTRFAHGSDSAKKRKRSSLARVGKSFTGKDSTFLMTKRDDHHSGGRDEVIHVAGTKMMPTATMGLLHRRLHEFSSSVSEEDAEGEMEDDYLAPELEPKPLVDIALPEPIFVSRHSLGSYYPIPAMTTATATTTLNNAAGARTCASARPELVLPPTLYCQSTAGDGSTVQGGGGAAVSYTALHSFGRPVSLTSGQNTLSAATFIPSAHPSPVLSSPGYSACSAVSSQASSVATPLPTPTSDTQFYDDSSYRHQPHVGGMNPQDSSKPANEQLTVSYGSLGVDTPCPTATFPLQISSTLRPAKSQAHPSAAHDLPPSQESRPAFGQLYPLHIYSHTSAVGSAIGSATCEPVDYCSFTLVDSGFDTADDSHRSAQQVTHSYSHPSTTMDWPASDFIPASFST